MISLVQGQRGSLVSPRIYVIASTMNRCASSVVGTVRRAKRRLSARRLRRDLVEHTQNHFACREEDFGSGPELPRLVIDPELPRPRPLPRVPKTSWEVEVLTSLSSEVESPSSLSVAFTIKQTHFT